ncbi:MAG: type II secretion system F family protein, partial [Candidatus Baltobacteraceae bacterium]
LLLVLGMTYSRGGILALVVALVVLTALGDARLRGLAVFVLAVAACVTLMRLLSNVSLGMIVAVVLALIAWRLPKVFLDRAIKARKAAVERSLPNFLDMLSTTVRAGLALNAAMIQATDVAVGALQEELRSALAEIRLGRSRGDALSSMAKRVNEPQLTTMVTSILQAESLGSNIAHVLHELAIETRNHRWHRAEERAAQLPVKMVFPMALLMLPSLYVLIFGPVGASLLIR